MRRLKSRRALTALCVVMALAVGYGLSANRTDVAQAQASAHDIIIAADGAERHVRTAETTVGAALEQAGIQPGPADLICPEPNVRLYNGMRVQVVRVVEKVVSCEEPIAFAVRRKPTNELRVGLNRVISEGQRGLKRLSYRVRCEDGVVKKREFLHAEVAVAPKDKVILVGDRGAGVSRGSFTSRRVLIMHATAYDPSPRSCGRYASGRTCTGMKAGRGVVAVDPRVISLGSRLYIEGYGFAIAGDRGRSIKGLRIDLGFDTYRAAKRFGRRHVIVHML